MLKTNALGSQKIAKISYNEEMNLISTIYLGKNVAKNDKIFLKKGISLRVSLYFACFNKRASEI